MKKKIARKSVNSLRRWLVQERGISAEAFALLIRIMESGPRDESRLKIKSAWEKRYGHV